MSHLVRQPALNRRSFLGRTLYGAAAGVLGGSLLPGDRTVAAAPARSEAGAAAAGAVATAASPWTLRLSCSSINFSSLPIEQACQRIAALGFEAIDIWSAHAGCPHLDDVAKRLGSSGLKDLLARNQLKLYAFSVYTGGYAAMPNCWARPAVESPSAAVRAPPSPTSLPRG